MIGISKGDKDYTIKFRNWNYGRLFYESFQNHLFCWCFGIWNENRCDCWIDKGIRILGVEINIRDYNIKRSRK